MTETVQRLAQQFAERVKAEFPEAEVRLFGSQARGDATADSDIDLCVIVENRTNAKRDRISHIAWEVGFCTGELLTTVVLTREEFQLRRGVLPTLVISIERDGVVL